MCRPTESKAPAPRLEAEPFDLLLTDLKTPGMSGIELILRARVLRPAMPSVLLSGSVEEAAPEITAHGIVHLSKPYKSAELLATIERLLAARIPR